MNRESIEIFNVEEGDLSCEFASDDLNFILDTEYEDMFLVNNSMPLRKGPRIGVKMIPYKDLKHAALLMTQGNNAVFCKKEDGTYLVGFFKKVSKE